MDALQSILSAIQQQQDTFPAAQRQVAAYVVKNYESIPFLSITTLAQNIQVSEKTIISFCNSIGFSKFTEFKKALSEHAQSKLVITNKLSRRGSEAQNHIFDTIAQQDIHAITATMALEENRKQLPKAVELLNASRHIYVTGGRASGIVARMLATMLRYLSLKVHELHLGGDYYDRLTMVDKEDVVVAFCFSRYTSQVVEGLQYLHSKDIPIILITDMELSSAFPYARAVFHCDATAEGYFPTYSGCLSLIYALCSELGTSRSEEAIEHTRELENMLMEKNIFK